MIDTIILTLEQEAFTITHPERFEPSAAVFLKHAYPPKGFKAKQIAKKSDLASGLYRPRLTLFSRLVPFHGYKTLLKIEFSAPKLLLGNNFEELTEDHLPLLVKKLVVLLGHMGIATTAQALMQAPVSAVHYAKNILLTDGSTPYHYINKIKETNISLLLDVNQTDFRNEGHSFKWHCNSYEVAFYDKIRDLEKAKKSDKRCMEKDPAFAFGYGGQASQLHLFEHLYNRPLFEVLRMEVRLNKRSKIKQLFTKLNIDAPLAFADLFSASIARTVLLHYLDEIEKKRPPLLDFKAATEKGLLASMIINNLHLNPRSIMMLYGLKLALKHVSMRELRTMFGAHKARTWHRLMADARNVHVPKAANPFAVIRECLMAFEAVRKELLFKGGIKPEGQMEVI